MPFRFDINKTFQDNVTAYVEFLKASDPEHARILQDELPALMALPDGNKRGAARQAINRRISEKLDALPVPAPIAEEKEG